MNPTAIEILVHSGVGHDENPPGRGSGRYAWGSGKNPFQHSYDFMKRVNELKSQGLKETQIAEALGMKTGMLRTQIALAGSEQRSALVSQAVKLREEGKSLNQIRDAMGFKNDSSVRSLLNEDAARRMRVSRDTADYLKDLVDHSEYGMLDVGKGQNKYIGPNGISENKMQEALYLLEMQGYHVYGGRVPQVTNKMQQTTLKVLCKPDKQHKDIYNYDQISYIEDGDVVIDSEGKKRKAFEYPASLDSKRLAIVYGDKGGEARDGLVELRPGVKDISLGEAHYAQVRILVDGTHYIKGMAVYNDNLPEGVDVRFNVKYPSGTPIMGKKGNTVLKPIKNDPQNPFGSLIKENGGQSYYDDPNGKFTDPDTGHKQSLSLINKRGDEGDWGDWSHDLPSQFLSKQPLKLINQQLNIAKADKMAEFEEIKNLTNPSLKKYLLDSFASDCDGAAVNLKAAALPRQQYQVIMPIKSLKDNEIYAPNYKDGEQVALIRYPHGGTFEIPICTVNNKNKEGQKFLTKNPKDAVGINAEVAKRLSGADFDGDTVMVIPTNNGKVNIKSTPELRELKGFDPELLYGGKEEGTYKKMRNTQTEMGKISNLINDMTLAGATEGELAKAVKHSMVVIDAEKHGYDYKQSEKDNNIQALKKRYQGRIDEETGRYKDGASTLISKASAEATVLKREGSPIINKKGRAGYDPNLPEGALIWKTARDSKLYYEDTRKVKLKDEKGRLIRDAEGKEQYLKDENGKVVREKTGKIKAHTQASTQMAETRNAYDLVSERRNPEELAYADYANFMKSLANQARKEMIYTQVNRVDSTAKKAYSNEVSSLLSQLNAAEKNSPRERRAQGIANTIMKAKRQDNPDMTKKEDKKLSQMALTEARNKVGAKRVEIKINDSEWNAIQSGALSDTQLKSIFKYTDTDKLRERAMPRNTGLTAAQKAQIKAMSSTYTNKEIAERLGISASTVAKYL